MRFTVAIDGPAAAGKGTIGRALAQRFSFAHLDTGTLYRAVGLAALDAGRGVIDAGMAEVLARRLGPSQLDRGDLRSDRASRAASRVAAMPGVRTALLEFQREFARREGGAVLDGRDIGTVICPEAEVKLYVTASDAARARRRHAELAEAGGRQTVAQVAADLAARDARDAGRSDAPLTRAPDAHLLDTTGMSVEEALAAAVAIVKERLAR